MHILIISVITFFKTLLLEVGVLWNEWLYPFSSLECVQRTRFTIRLLEFCPVVLYVVARRMLWLLELQQQYTSFRPESRKEIEIT